MESDARYYRRRAIEERMAAQRAVTEQARTWHAKLAKDFADGLENTVLVVEAADPVPWTKPAELAFAPECSLPPLGGRFRDVFLAALCDGNVLALPITLGEDRLFAAITRSGNENVGRLWDLSP